MAKAFIPPNTHVLRIGRHQAVLEASVDHFDASPDRKAEMVIKLFAVDRKLLEGGTPAAPKARSTAKSGPPEAPGGRCSDAESSGCAIATESEAVNTVEIVGSGDALQVECV